MFLVSDLETIIQDGKNLDRIVEFVKVKSVTHKREHRGFGCKQGLFCYRHGDFIFLSLCNSSIARVNLETGKIEYSDFILEQTGNLGEDLIDKDGKFRVEECGIRLVISGYPLGFLFPFYELEKEGVSVFYACPNEKSNLLYFALGSFSGYLHFFYYPNEFKYILDVHVFDVGAVSILGHAKEVGDLLTLCEGNCVKEFVMGKDGIRRYKGERIGRRAKIRIERDGEEARIKRPVIVDDGIFVTLIFDGGTYASARLYRYGIVWKEYLGRSEDVFGLRGKDGIFAGKD